jgi:hypothetical protein
MKLHDGPLPPALFRDPGSGAPVFRAGKPPRLLVVATWVFAGASGFFGLGGSHLLVPGWSDTAHAATAAGGELLGLVGLFIAAASVEGGFESPEVDRKKR